ncbi:hypothetical protein ACHQM5_009095 [Ranunculus cassubicifolius]
MGAFVEICKGTPPKLKKLEFEECNELLTATPRKLIQNFLNLKSLKIEDCPNLLPANGRRSWNGKMKVSIRACKPSHSRTGGSYRLYKLV